MTTELKKANALQEWNNWLTPDAASDAGGATSFSPYVVRMP